LHISRRFILPFLALLALIPATLWADEGDADLSQIRPIDLVSPSESWSDFLSGRVWMIANGLDPVLSIGLGSVKDAPANSGILSPAAQAGGGAAALVPYRDPSTKFSRNVLVSEDVSPFPFQTEPSLAVDPKDPDHLLLGLIDYGFPNMITYSSIDGGASWDGPNGAKYPRQDLASAGDPIVAFDRNGGAYLAYISLDVEEFTIGPFLAQAIISGIAVARSSDGGFNWEESIDSTRSTVATQLLPSTDGRLRGEIKTGFLDKPWMAIGPHPTEPEKDVIYIAYTKFVDTANIFWIDELPVLSGVSLETVIELVKSEDGGITWTQPIEVSPRASYNILLNAEETGPAEQQELGPATGARQIVQGPDVDVADDGAVYVAWMDSTNDDSFEGRAEIRIARSDNAGATFQSPVVAAAFLEPSFRARNLPFRSWSSAFPKLGITPNGNVTVLWMGLPTDDPQDDGDVFSATSTDQGRTWSRRIKVNDDETSAFQFFPELTSDPDGNLHAMWGDFRDDRDHVSYHIYYSTSEDNGQTWSQNSRVTDFPSNPNRAFPGGRFIGDYFAITANEKDVYMVWSDSRLGEFGPANQKIAFARTRLMPQPSIFISPPSGPAGEDVIIQGFNFQAQQDIFVQVDGVILSTARTQADGGFSTQIFMPISGEGPHDVRVIESSGNVASTSFFMDFGFDNVQETTDKLDVLIETVADLDVGAGGESATTEQMAAEIQELVAAVNALNARPVLEPHNDGLSRIALGLGSGAALLALAAVAWAITVARRSPPPAPAPAAPPVIEPTIPERREGADSTDE